MVSFVIPGSLMPRFARHTRPGMTMIFAADRNDLNFKIAELVGSRGKPDVATRSQE
jgi:hypothetical protein